MGVCPRLVFPGAVPLASVHIGRVKCKRRSYSGSRLATDFQLLLVFLGCISAYHSGVVDSAELDVLQTLAGDKGLSYAVLASVGAALRGRPCS